MNTWRGSRKMEAMAVNFRHFLHSPNLSASSPLASKSPPRLSKRPPMFTASSTPPSSTQSSPAERSKFIDFPFVSVPHKNLMVDIVSTMENRLDSHLFPCSLPLDVQHYQNHSGTSQGSLHIRSGHQSSNIDFILGSWLHCQLPTGGALNITSLSAYLNSSTDAPNFLLELVRSSPTCLVLILDLPPRKDLVLNPNYLKTFYEDTQLDSRKKMLEKFSEVRPFSSSSLYIRCLVSPTAIMARIETEVGGAERMEEIVQNHIHPIAKEVLEIWLDQCAFGVREIGETEKASLKMRDEMIRRKTIEIDLGTNLPRLFEKEISDRIIEVISSVFIK